MAEDPVILVSAIEGEDPIEIELEHDGTCLLSSVQSQFPNCIGIKYRNPTTGAFRGVKLVDGVLQPPSVNGGWGDPMERTYIVNLAPSSSVGNGNAASPIETSEIEPEPRRDLKRRGESPPEDESEAPKRANSTKSSSRSEMLRNRTDPHEEDLPEEERQRRREAKDRVLNSLCGDLIVLNLPYTFTYNDMKDHFGQFGELDFCEIKKDKDGKSRGFGFIRYCNYEDQKRVQGQTYSFENRKVEVRKPKGKDGSNGRMHVGQLHDGIGREDLFDFFEQFGEVRNIHYEHMKKRYAFIEFENPDIASALIKEKEMYVKNSPLIFSAAEPKGETRSGGGGRDESRSRGRSRDRSRERDRDRRDHRDSRDYGGRSSDDRHHSRSSGAGAPSSSDWLGPDLLNSSRLTTRGRYDDGLRGLSSSAASTLSRYGGALGDGGGMVTDMARIMAEALNQQIESRLASGQDRLGGYYPSDLPRADDL